MMNLNGNDTAVVLIDPQNEVLSENGAAWDAVGDSVRANKTSVPRAVGSRKPDRGETIGPTT